MTDFLHFCGVGKRDVRFFNWHLIEGRVQLGAKVIELQKLR